MKEESEEKELLNKMVKNFEKLKNLFPDDPIYRNYYNNVKKSIKKIENKKIMIIK